MATLDLMKAALLIAVSAFGGLGIKGGRWGVKGSKTGGAALCLSRIQPFVWLDKKLELGNGAPAAFPHQACVQAHMLRGRAGKRVTMLLMLLRCR